MMAGIHSSGQTNLFRFLLVDANARLGNRRLFTDALISECVQLRSFQWHAKYGKEYTGLSEWFEILHSYAKTGIFGVIANSMSLKSRSPANPMSSNAK